MVCSRSQPNVELSRDLAKKLASTYEEWATKCLVKANQIRQGLWGDQYNLEKAQHLDMEADYWFGLAEQMRREANFEMVKKDGTIRYK